MSAPFVALPKVWIADDSPVELSIAKKALDGAYDVRSFSNGLSLIEAISSGEQPDAVILDWEMPELSGLEVCQFLRATPATIELPILVLTSHGRTEDLVRGLAAGANDYVAKPFSSPELSARVAALVRARRLRERAEHAESALADVVAHLPDAVLGVDHEGVMRYVNEEATRMLGRPAAELVGTPVLDVVPLLRLDTSTDDAADLPDVTIGERRYAPLHRALPVARGIATTYSFRDVTEKRRVEARKLDFYSIIAHDLRTPLSAISLRTELLVQGTHGDLDPKHVLELGKVQRSVRQLTELLNDFLDLAKIEGTGVQLDRSATDLVALVREVVSDAEPVAQSKHVALSVECASAAVVYADRRRLAQVLSNLVSNALKFTSRGHVTVRIVASRERAHVRVEDTGCGLTPESRAKLFQRYARADESKHIAGTGLGLMIVREIVEAHGGIVGVESEPGRGSTFWFDLPWS